MFIYLGNYLFIFVVEQNEIQISQKHVYEYANVKIKYLWSASFPFQHETAWLVLFKIVKLSIILRVSEIKVSLFVVV